MNCRIIRALLAKVQTNSPATRRITNDLASQTARFHDRDMRLLPSGAAAFTKTVSKFARPVKATTVIGQDLLR
jgi:hypothetical protein